MKAIIPKQLDEDIKANLSIVRKEYEDFLKYSESEGLKLKPMLSAFIYPRLVYFLFGRTNQEILFSKFTLAMISYVGGVGPGGERPGITNIYDKKKRTDELVRKGTEMFNEAIFEKKLTTVGTLATTPTLPSPGERFDARFKELASDTFRMFSDMAVENTVSILYAEDRNEYFGMTHRYEAIEIEIR
jgi:hypothetical protein